VYDIYSYLCHVCSVLIPLASFFELRSWATYCIHLESESYKKRQIKSFRANYGQLKLLYDASRYV
jgi:hypothetical protein